MEREVKIPTDRYYVHLWAWRLAIDDGLSFVDTVTTTDQIDIIAQISVAEEDIGMTGVFHVLSGLGNSGFFQLNDSGELESWNGTFEGLMPYGEAMLLRELEHFHILDDY